jgi:transketolase
MSDAQYLSSLSTLTRAYILESTTTAGSGHPTSSLSATDLLVHLFFNNHFKADINHHEYHNNDRLIFSKGHASPLFYSLYAVAGELTREELNTFRKFDSPLEGHATRRFPFTEVPTGSLGQGLGIGLGMAMSARMDGLDFATYVLLGDSEMAEGSVWEAVEIASFYQTDNLIAILDVNRLGQRGETMLGYDTSAYAERFTAFGWKVIEIDGHHDVEIDAAFTQATEHTGSPIVIIAKTQKGAGISFLADQAGWHGKTLNQEELKRALDELGTIDYSLRGTITQPNKLDIREYIPKNKEISFPNKDYSTRQAYGDGLVLAHKNHPNMVVLDAETSNSTFAATFAEYYPEKFIECFIAEQNMISMATGMARRGKTPFISTFAAFLSRAHDHIRMSQYAHVPINIVGSHCGVSIGEDGGSQMALEDIAMMRSIRNSVVLYPGDAVATIKLVDQMACNDDHVCYLRTTRANTPVIYAVDEEFPIGGSKTLRTSESDVVTVFAAGITLHEALKAADILKEKGIFIRVIDLYSIKPLDVDTIKKAVIETKKLLVVEDHRIEGGMYEAICGSGVVTCPIYSLSVTIEPRSGTPKELLTYAGIDTDTIVEFILEC